MARRVIQADTEEQLIGAADLLNQAAREFLAMKQSPWTPTETSPSLLRQYMQDGELYLVEEDDAYLGIMMLQEEDRQFWPDAASHTNAMYIRKLALAPAAIGVEVAQLLIEYAQVRAKVKDKRYLRLIGAKQPELRQIYEGAGMSYHSEWNRGPLNVWRFQVDLGGAGLIG